MRRTALLLLPLALAATAPAPALADGSTAVTLTSEPGDPLGVTGEFASPAARAVAVYGPRGVRIEVPTAQGLVTIDLASRLTRTFAVGAYPGTVAIAARTITQPGLEVAVPGRTCPAPTGSFTVSRFTRGTLALVGSFDATFELRCAGATGSLRGTISVAGAGTPVSTPIRGASRRVQAPSQAVIDGQRWLLWTDLSRGATRTALRRGTAPIVFVAERRREVWGGGLDPEGIVLQVANRPRSTSDLRLHVPASLAQRRLPAGVNTPAWEWRPDLDGSTLLFGRQRGPREQILVASLAPGGRVRTLVTDVDPRTALSPGRVAGGLAAFHRCRGWLCESVIVNVRRPTQRITVKGRRSYYDPAPADDGSTYVISSRRGCGASVMLEQIGNGTSTRSLVLRLPRGVDAGWPDALVVGDRTYLLYTRVNCGTRQTTLHEVVIEMPRGAAALR